MRETILAYIAGFLDGDGSIMLQLKPRADYAYGYQIKATVSFYQKQSNRSILEWLHENLKIGTVRDRNDGISQYDVEGIEPVRQVLELLQPYVVLKHEQVSMALCLIDEMTTQIDPSPEEFLKWCGQVEAFQALNYSKRRKHVQADVRDFLERMGYLDPRND